MRDRWNFRRIRRVTGRLSALLAGLALLWALDLAAQQPAPSTPVEEPAGAELPERQAPAAGSPLVLVATIEGMIGPVSAEFLENSIERAEESGAALLVVRLDTPGGLLEATREMVKQIMASPVPIAIYVAPSGSRAGSAGVFLTMAAHVAAMAPGTNIGAAHPVSVGPGGGGEDGGRPSVMEEKVLNDAVAFIRSVAEQRGRNAAWADSAVRYSVSVTETGALARGVIEFIAPTVRALADSLDGYRVAVAGQDSLALELTGATLVQREYNWRYRLLNRLTDPNIAYILFLVGLVGLYFELSNPGAIFPGVIGAISLILAFFAFQALPVNYAGLLLIFLATVLFVLEIKIPSFGLLTVGGLIALVLGSIMLYQEGVSPTMPEIALDWVVLLPSVLAMLAFFVFVVGKAIQSQRRKTTTGNAGMVGEEGHTLTRLNPEGSIFIHGEIWKAVSPSGEIPPKTPVRVLEVQGLRLVVEPIDRGAMA